MIASEEFFSKLKNQFQRDLPFVAYRNPEKGSILKAFLQVDTKKYIIGDFTESGFVFAPFDTENPIYYIPSDFSLKTEYIPSNNHNILSGTDRAILDIEKEKHLKLVEKGIEAIKANKFQKVVLSRKEEIAIKEPDPILVFKNLLQKYQNAFVYVFFHPKIGLWLGATPETLISLQRNQLSTMALAGTQKNRGKSDVHWGEKEKEEQKFVSFSILENLKNSGVTKIKVSEAYTSKAGNLLHLRTDIQGELNPETSIGKIISTLHPTPAVCGLPKKPAQYFISENEGYDREYYTGFLGELNIRVEIKRNTNKRNQENRSYSAIVNTTRLFVNLRCMKLSSEKATVFIGGGITKDSDPLAEWEETVNKAETMKAVLE